MSLHIETEEPLRDRDVPRSDKSGQHWNWFARPSGKGRAAEFLLILIAISSAACLFGDYADTAAICFTVAVAGLACSRRD
jgi:hypothetical protein